jgi:flagellar basal-body rod protein FlgC
MADDLMNSMAVSTQGMRAQSIRIRVISENVANADSAANFPGEDPFQRKIVTFKNVLDKELGTDTVRVKKVDRDQTPFPVKYMPGHPGADGNGYVKMPNINSAIEMMDMREAQRSYEANLNMMNMTRQMANQTVGMLDR